jgi:hypothetical protein
MTMDVRVSRGSLVIGAMLMAVGVGLLLDRSGMSVWPDRWHLWPILLFGVGVAQLVESPSGGPYRGLLLIAGGVWLLGVQAGWLSVGTSWPLLVVALGIAISVGGISRRRDTGAAVAPGERRQGRSLAPLAILGIWVAILLAGAPPGIDWTERDSNDGRTRVFRVMGNASPTVPEGAFKGGDVVAVMGRSELDLTRATLAPGEEVTIDVFTLMGRTVVKVPRDWVVDVKTRAVAGSIRDERRVKNVLPELEATHPPKVTVRGLVGMGSMAIRY